MHPIFQRAATSIRDFRADRLNFSKGNFDYKITYELRGPDGHTSGEWHASSSILPMKEKELLLHFYQSILIQNPDSVILEAHWPSGKVIGKNLNPGRERIKLLHEVSRTHSPTITTRQVTGHRL